MPLKMLCGAEIKPLPYWLDIGRVGNLIMVKWSLEYVASKSMFYFNKYQKYFFLCKKVKFKTLSFIKASFVVKKCSGCTY